MNTKNCVCIGINAGGELTNEEGYIRIGNFTEEEIKTKKYKDCLIIQDGKVVIKRDVVDFLGIDYLNNPKAN
jgi:hypothetical protein